MHFQASILVAPPLPGSRSVFITSRRLSLALSASLGLSCRCLPHPTCILPLTASHLSLPHIAGSGISFNPFLSLIPFRRKFLHLILLPSLPARHSPAFPNLCCFHLLLRASAAAPRCHVVCPAAHAGALSRFIVVFFFVLVELFHLG